MTFFQHLAKEKKIANFIHETKRRYNLPTSPTNTALANRTGTPERREVALEEERRSNYLQKNIYMIRTKSDANYVANFTCLM